MKPFLAVVLTIVIMAGLAGGGYYYLNKQQTKEKNDLQAQIDDLNAKLVAEKKASEAAAAVDTTSWKTYSSTNYGFSFKYPNDWEVRDLTSANSQIKNLSFYVGANPTSSKEDTLFNVEIVNSPVATELATATGTKQEVTKYGTSATEVTSTNQTTNASTILYYIGKNSKTYIISGKSTYTSDPNTVIGNQISDTFQFTK